jgi:hypothetical protein
MVFENIRVQFSFHSRGYMSYVFCHYFIEQEGHDGPGVAHLYIGPRSGASLNPRAFIWTNLEDTH